MPEVSCDCSRRPFCVKPEVAPQRSLRYPSCPDCTWNFDSVTLACGNSYFVCVQTVRQVLKDHLEKISPDKDWSFITSQIGMFSFTGLTPPQVSYLPTLPCRKWQVGVMGWLDQEYIGRLLSRDPFMLSVPCLFVPSYADSIRV